MCSSLASADPAIRAALFSRLCPSSYCATSDAASGSASFSAGLAADSAPAAVAAAAAASHAAAGGSGGSGSVGVPSSLGDTILAKAREIGCLTTSGVLELLRWCTPRVLSLQGVSPTVTDSLLLRWVGGEGGG